MVYNCNFALASIFFMLLTTVFYLRQNRMRDLQDHLFTIMLLGGLVAVIFDFIAGYLNPYGASVPAWILYLANAFFILGEHVCLPSFFLYTISASKKFNHVTKRNIVFAMFPNLIIVILVIISAFTKVGVFYITEEHTYALGATHMVLYIVAGLYLAASCVILAGNYKVIPTRKFKIIAGFALSILAASLVQIVHPDLLVTTSACALALTGMYFVLRAPGEQVDSFTGAFVRTLMPNILQNLHDKNCNYTLILYSVLNCDDVTRTHGVRLSDGLLISLSAWLRQSFPRDTVVYMNSSEFTVILARELSDEEAALLMQQAPLRLRVGENNLPVKLAISVLPCRSEAPTEKTLMIADYLFRQMRERNLAELFIADEKFLSSYSRISRLEENLDSVIREGTTQLKTRDVVRSDSGRAAFIDVSLTVQHEASENVSPGELFYALKQSGNIPWFYRQLIALVGQEYSKTDSETRFCLPLFAAALIQDGLADMLFELVTQAGIAPSRIVFRFSETEISESLTIMSKNISLLNGYGFGFRLDGFAEGYADMSILTALPIGSVTIDESLLHHAVSDPKGRSLLSCVIDILTDIGKEVICAGVDCRKDAELARSAGAHLLEGSWCQSV